MRTGPLRSLEDVKRELDRLDVQSIRRDYRSYEYPTPITVTTSSYRQYGAARFTVTTRLGDVVTFDALVSVSAGGPGSLIRARMVPVGLARSMTPNLSTSGRGTAIFVKAVDEPPPGINIYELQWATSTGTAYSADAEIFISTYS